MNKISEAEKHKDIARIDQASKRTHGWYSRVRFYGKTHAKFFSDKKHGGRHLALLSALAWRDETEKKIGKGRTDKHMVTVSNTTTGVVGVRLNKHIQRYEVSWVSTDGKQGKTSVSIRKHGKKKAFELACDIRQGKEAERLGVEINVRKQFSAVSSKATKENQETPRQFFTVNDLRAQIKGLPGKAELIFGEDGNLTFSRIQKRGVNLYQIEFK